MYVCFCMLKNMHVCLCMSACVLMYVCVHVSVSVCAGVSADVCACVCVSVHVYICGMPNIKFVSLAYMHVTKSAKCESGTTSVSMCVCVYLYCVCGVPNIKLVSLVWMWAKKCKMYIFLKINNFKNIIHRCLISFLWVAPVWVHNWAKY